MTIAVPSPTVDDVFLCLQPFCVAVVGGEVIRLPGNRVPMPKGSFVTLAPMLNSGLATNVAKALSSVDQTQTLTRSTMFTVQVDCYGPASSEAATRLAVLLRDSYACEYFAAINPAVQPLYTSDIRQLPLVAGEDQYIDRYTFEAVLQFNPSMVTPQASALRLSLDTFVPLP